MKHAIIVLVAVTVGAVPALAQTSAERSACTPDVLRLCGSHIPHAAAITACLRARRTSLSSTCRVVMDRSDRSVHNVTNRR